MKIITSKKEKLIQFIGKCTSNVNLPLLRIFLQLRTFFKSWSIQSRAKHSNNWTNSTLDKLLYEVCVEFCSVQLRNEKECRGKCSTFEHIIIWSLKKKTIHPRFNCMRVLHNFREIFFDLKKNISLLFKKKTNISLVLWN